MKLLRRLDEGLARGEAALAAVMLLAMILVAAADALLRNLGDLDLAWANAAHSALGDPASFLQVSTLWVAFLGASLATHHEKQIAIDVVPRLASPQVRAAMRGVVGLGAGVVAFMLAWTSWRVVLNIGGTLSPDVALDYEVLLSGGGTAHVCDAPHGVLAEMERGRPGVFCGVRSVLRELGAPMQSPASAALLIVPVMFLLIAIRLVSKGAAGFVAFARGQGVGPPSGLEEAAEQAGGQEDADTTADE